MFCLPVAFREASVTMTFQGTRAPSKKEMFRLGLPSTAALNAQDYRDSVHCKKGKKTVNCIVLKKKQRISSLNIYQIPYKKQQLVKGTGASAAPLFTLASRTLKVGVEALARGRNAAAHLR